MAKFDEIVMAEAKRRLANEATGLMHGACEYDYCCECHDDLPLAIARIEELEKQLTSQRFVVLWETVGSMYDHNCGTDWFDTLEEARSFVAWLKKEHTCGNLEWAIIRGIGLEEGR